MRRKDKESEKASSQQGAGDGADEVVRLPVEEGEYDAKSELERTKQLMGGNALPASSQTSEGDLEVSEPDAVLELADPEEEWDEAEATRLKVPFGFVALGGVVILGFVIWAAVVGLQGEKAVESKVQDVASKLEQEEEENRSALDFAKELDLVARKYLAAKTISEKAKYIRDRERVVPLMKDFYSRKELEPESCERVTSFSPLGLENQSFMLVGLEMSNASGDEKTKWIMVEQTEDNRVLVDWEADVAYQPIPLEEYLVRKPTEPVRLRLLVQKDHFYNYEFSDAERYLSVKLTDRDSDHYLFGYLERGSKAHDVVEELLQDNPLGYDPMIVQVRFMPDTESKRSVLVERIVEPRWIYTNGDGP